MPALALGVDKNDTEILAENTLVEGFEAEEITTEDVFEMNIRPITIEEYVGQSEVKENYLDIIKNTENYYFEYSFNFLPLLFGFFIVYSFAIPTVPAACLLGIITFTSIKVDMYKKEEE